jgi:hypothetical protein
MTHVCVQSGGGGGGGGVESTVMVRHWIWSGREALNVIDVLGRGMETREGGIWSAE